MVEVLLVEDDPVIARIIQFYLEQEASYSVAWAKTAGEAMALSDRHFDAVLLDILLPDVNGIDLCSRLREWHRCPIIFISCLDNTETIVNALRAGGDDFMTKPFDNRVLVAKIEANIRRASQAQIEVANGTIACEGFVLDPARRLVVRPDGEAHLSPQEFRILHLLMTSPNRYFTAEEIYTRIWGKESFGDVRNVVVHIHNIRKKIEPSDGVRYLKNAWGRGYTFDPTGRSDDTQQGGRP